MNKNNSIIKLNLGCGPDIKSGYLNIDTCSSHPDVIVQDIRSLDFDYETIDEIYAKDIIEHMSMDDFKHSISKWSRICKTGALLFIQTICIDLIIEAYIKGIWNLETLNYMLFAGKNWVDGISRNEDFHKSCYSKEFLEQVLSQNQFKILSIEFDKIDGDIKYNPYAHNLNIIVKAVKI